MTINPLLESATEHHRAGHLSEARRLYAQFLAANPGHDLALFRSGLLEFQERRLETALGSIQKAASAAPRANTTVKSCETRISLSQLPIFTFFFSIN